ncbi:MAG: MFS transporter [Acidobacteria bacterium]|nr:MFS transporter [Acidobacteriota bacterium]
MTIGFSFTREEKSWILYDVANSAFVLIIVTTLMPLFFKDVASQGVPDAESTANWAFATSLASLILAVSAPFLGTFADYAGWKKRFFAFFLLAGVAGTLLLPSVGMGQWLWCLVLYIFAKVCYSGANLFYDAFLVDVTTDERMDWVSASGFGWGYIGSVIPFLLVMVFLFFGGVGEGDAGAMPAGAARVAFIITAVWWLAFSIPMLRRVRQRHAIASVDRPVREAVARLWHAVTHIRRYRQAFLFLLAYFFYIDGVDTVITMATAYGRDLGLGVTTLVLVVLFIQIVAFPFALLYGRLAAATSARTMIFVGIGVYAVITALAFFLPVIPDMSTRIALFWVLALLVASSQGGIQALSRSFFGKLIPKEKSAEFFGFYNIFGRFATILGPLMMGLFGRLTGHSRYGVLAILPLFLLGGLILTRVKAGAAGGAVAGQIPEDASRTGKE